MAFVLHKPYTSPRENRLVDLPFVRPGKAPARATSEAARAFEAMREAARRDGVSLLIVSAYRSREEQKACFADARRRHGRFRGVKWVAPPGYSEHHTGCVFDIGDEGVPEADDGPLFEGTPAFRWLRHFATRFGFELSFPRGNSGRVSYESWHWRFVGTPEAREVFHPKGFRKWLVWMEAFFRSLY
jgi:D-alanyl-D-alanine carboxypeptidase